MNLKELLLKLDEKLAEQLLEDLKDESLRNPQLYNAIGKFLDRHKITVSSMEPEEDTTDTFKSALSDYDKVVSISRAVNED